MDEIEGVAVAGNGEGNRRHIQPIVLSKKVERIAAPAKVDVHGQLRAPKRAQQRVILPFEEEVQGLLPTADGKGVLLVEPDGGGLGTLKNELQSRLRGVRRGNVEAGGVAKHWRQQGRDE